MPPGRRKRRQQQRLAAEKQQVQGGGPEGEGGSEYSSTTSTPALTPPHTPRGTGSAAPDWLTMEAVAERDTSAPTKGGASALVLPAEETRPLAPVGSGNVPAGRPQASPGASEASERPVSLEIPSREELPLLNANGSKVDEVSSSLAQPTPMPAVEEGESVNNPDLQPPASLTEAEETMPAATSATATDLASNHGSKLPGLGRDAPPGEDDHFTSKAADSRPAATSTPPAPEAITDPADGAESAETSIRSPRSEQEGVSKQEERHQQRPMDGDILVGTTDMEGHSVPPMHSSAHDAADAEQQGPAQNGIHRALVLQETVDAEKEAAGKGGAGTVTLSEEAKKNGSLQSVEEPSPIKGCWGLICWLCGGR